MADNAREESQRLIAAAVGPGGPVQTQLHRRHPDTSGQVECSTALVVVRGKAGSQRSQVLCMVSVTLVAFSVHTNGR